MVHSGFHCFASAKASLLRGYPHCAPNILNAQSCCERLASADVTSHPFSKWGKLLHIYKPLYSTLIMDLMSLRMLLGRLWHSTLTPKQSQTLESIQRRACKIMLGFEYVSYVNALEICDLDLLSAQRETHCLNFARSLLKSECTKMLIPPQQRGDSWQTA